MSDARTSASRPSWDLAIALLYVLVIFVVGSLPGAPQAAGGISDKVQHAVAFALLAWLWCRALKRMRPESGLARNALGGFLLSSGVGGILELWQALLSYRTCEFLDWVADGAGAALAVTLYAAIPQLFGARARAAE